MTTGLLERQTGVDSLTVTLAGLPLPTVALSAVRMTHGRTGIGQRPSPAVCVLAFRDDALAQLPGIGDALTVELGEDAATRFELTGAALDAASRRFVGEVTDVTSAPTRGQPYAAVLTVTAVSRRARLGRVFIGDAPWPQESDGARAGRILAAANASGAGLTVGAVDDGTVQVLAQDADRTNPLQLLDALSVDSGGEVVEGRDGVVRWYDADHRITTEPAIDLHPEHVLARVGSTLDLDGLVNDLAVEFGPADDRQSLSLDDPDSIARYGPYSARVSTQLATLADAETFATRELYRRSTPRWRLGTVTVDLLRTVDAAQAATLLQLDQASSLRLVDFAVRGAYVSPRVWLEGWTETVTRHGWQLALAVIDRTLLAPPDPWTAVPVGVSWTELPADLSWFDASGYEFAYAPGA